jgi:hypothetical protein
MENYNLFLDDFRNPEDAYEYFKQEDFIEKEWIVVRNYDEFINKIQEKGVPQILSFDHDLSDVHYTHQDTEIPYDEKTGFHCAKWLINYCIDNNLKLTSRIYIHSMNVVGTENIKSLFDTYYKLYNE